ncbi:MAG: hypothetical protein ACR2F2_00590 [Pyrinomonadaceae bacterium]
MLIYQHRFFYINPSNDYEKNSLLSVGNKSFPAQHLVYERASFVSLKYNILEN